MKNLRKYLIFALVISVFGEVNFYLFNTTLRFSAAIIVLNIILLVDEEVTPFTTCIFAGITVFLQRSLFDILFYSISIQDVFFLHGPAIVYYVIYGSLVSSLDFNEENPHIIATVAFLAFTDIMSNTMEILVRRGDNLVPPIGIFIMVGIIRSIISYLIFLFYKRQEIFLVSQEHIKKYAQLNLLVSSIQAEMFYLKKSTNDIENVMKKSYALYDDYKEHEDLKERTLNIALEIHEIKKDYYRVLKGFESFLDNFEENKMMKVSDMFTIIRENTSRYLKENQLDIAIDLDYHEDFHINKYYHLFTVINNLISNAIDACGGNGEIKVNQKIQGDNVMFEVIDSGGGIEEEILPYIFNPGFTTKYDERSGTPSTGIGLSHVKGMVQELQGEINVNSKEGKTSFEIMIPKKILIG